MKSNPYLLYQKLQKHFIKDVKSDINLELITEIGYSSFKFLSSINRLELRSLVSNKQYFAFYIGKNKEIISRAVNSHLFIKDFKIWENFCKKLKERKFEGISSQEITEAIYTTAISFCCFVDLHRVRDQKTPGTFFEYLIGHLFAKRLGLNPERALPVLNLDMQTLLPTDYVFNLGIEKAKFHLPVKTSTRERVIQVWAHQRVLDGVYGTGRFLGTPVILTETKTDKRKLEVIEICLPDQWRIYQMHIAQLKRIYYLDVPVSYEKLNTVFPPISVKPFGDFFLEADILGVEVF